MSTNNKGRKRSNLRFRKPFQASGSKQTCFKGIELLIVLFKLVDAVLKLIDKIK